MEKIFPNIKHVVVLMLENRSFDNLVGWLYDADTSPNNWVVPNGSDKQYKGLAFGNYSNPDGKGVQVPVKKGTANYYVPTPDPNEKFDRMTLQQYWDNPDPTYGSIAPMNGFLQDYANAIAAQNPNPQPLPSEIMETYTPEQVSGMSLIASQYAISDYWFGACPTQTLPNRAFMGAGTSEGRVNNLTFPYIFGAKTIFNVLSDNDVSWEIYNQPEYIPSLTRLMFDRLWLESEDHFGDMEDFYADCDSNSLPAYTFLEPIFLEDLFGKTTATSEHPPANVAAGDAFVKTVWNRLTKSPSWKDTLFILTYDEHGGNYDHVPPPWGCVPPDSKSNPGHEGFCFNRWGVRIPTIIASPYIPQGTVFRSTGCMQYDHTSILATVLKWQGISNKNSECSILKTFFKWLGIKTDEYILGERVEQAPTFEAIVSLTEPRADTIYFETPLPPPAELRDRSSDAMTDLEHGALRAMIMFSHNGKLSEAEINNLLKDVNTLGDAAEFMKANQGKLKIKKVPR